MRQRLHKLRQFILSIRHRIPRTIIEAGVLGIGLVMPPAVVAAVTPAQSTEPVFFAMKSLKSGTSFDILVFEGPVSLDL